MGDKQLRAFSAVPHCKRSSKLGLGDPFPSPQQGGEGLGLSPEYLSLLPPVLCISVLIAPGLEEELQCVSQEDWGVGEVLMPAGETFQLQPVGTGAPIPLWETPLMLCRETQQTQWLPRVSFGGVMPWFVFGTLARGGIEILSV